MQEITYKMYEDSLLIFIKRDFDAINKLFASAIKLDKNAISYLHETEYLIDNIKINLGHLQVGKLMKASSIFFIDDEGVCCRNYKVDIEGIPEPKKPIRPDYMG